SQQLQCFVKVSVQYRCMETDLFFRGIGIQLTPYVFKTIDNVERTSFFCSFECHMLPEMRKALLKGQLITAADIQHNAAMGDLGIGNLFMCNTDSIRKRM